MLIPENVTELFKLEDDFGQVIKKTKVNANFLFNLGFILMKLKRSNKKLSLKDVYFPQTLFIKNC